MRNSLKYSINDRFYMEAALEHCNDQESRRMLTLRLYEGDEQVVIAKKRFSWPEQCLPNEMIVDNEKQLIILKGTNNIAKVPIRLEPEKWSFYAGTSADSALSASVYPSLPSSPGTESVDSVAAQICECLAEEDLKAVWNALSKIAKKANASPSDHLHVTIPAHLQISLIKILRKHVNEKHFNRVLTFLIHSRLITTSRASCKLVQLLADENLIPQMLTFVRSSLILGDRIFALCLKISSNETFSRGLNLLLSLLEKPINSCGLRRAVSQNLTEIEVTTLIERLISLSCDAERNDLFVKILKLEALLADSHSQRFVWDEKCHSAIEDAASFSSAMAQTISLFRHLEQRLEQEKKIADDVPEINGDYFVRKINFIQKSI